MRVAPRSCVRRDGRPFEIGSAEPRDIGRLLDQLVVARTTDPAADVPDPDEVSITVQAVASMTSELLESSNGVLLVARAGDDLLGSLSLRGGRYRKTKHVAKLGMRVDRGVRRQGVGRALVEAALDVAQACPLLDIVTLEVFSSNDAALALYEAAGFVVEGRRAGFVRQDHGDDDVILMSRRVATT